MGFISFIIGGLFVGLLSGAFGIGGGVVIVPMLMLLFGFTQKMAQGTSLAVFLVAPSLLATLAYLKTGNVDLKASAFLWVGIFFGSLIGAYAVNNWLPQSAEVYLRRAFCIMIAIIAVKLWFN